MWVKSVQILKRAQTGIHFKDGKRGTDPLQFRFIIGRIMSLKFAQILAKNYD